MERGINDKFMFDKRSGGKFMFIKTFQDCLVETSWRRSSPKIVSDTGQEEEKEENLLNELSNENRKPRLKMFKLKCLNKVASFSIFK